MDFFIKKKRFVVGGIERRREKMGVCGCGKNPKGKGRKKREKKKRGKIWEGLSPPEVNSLSGSEARLNLALQFG